MPDPDLEISGGSSRPLDKGGGGLPPPNFLALRASFWSKNRGGGSPPGPSHGSAAIS